MSEQAKYSASSPKRIRPLDPQLVNRIAAGEIIQRPFNALKELIENSLDAGSTCISIQIKDGGLKLIQIQDNGCGIEKDDLKIICERFTTSKLKEFDELKSINTFGFRGEALASISHISRLGIITRTKESACAYKASYTEGKLTLEGIKPCASASNGTQITVEDLFYNSSIRKNALRNSSEEFSKIYDVVSRYAIHNYHVSFCLKRVGENNLDLKTSGLPSSIHKRERCIENEQYLLDCIALVFGGDLRKELERLEIRYDERLKFEMFSYISNAKYTQLKQMTFVLFINERLVDCNPLKKALQNIFALYMPKNTMPFIYMSLSIRAENLDVNIHPTKHEVRFLHQDEIIEKIQECLEQKLLNSNASRTYYVKNLTLDSYVEGNVNKKPSLADESIDDELSDSLAKTNESKKASLDSQLYPYQVSRVDSKERKLDSYFHQSSFNESIRNLKEKEMIDESESLVDKSVMLASKNCSQQLKSPLRNHKLQRIFNFKSLVELRTEVEENASEYLRQTLSEISFVGCLERELALIQHETGLYVINTRLLSEELFYQICLFQFGNFGYFRLQHPIAIYELAFMALEDPQTEWTPDDGPKEKLSKRCAKFLYTKSTMLEDYFSVKIKKTEDDENKQDTIELVALPMLIEDYEPDLIDLPLFVIRLATEVDWDNEKDCFYGICKEIAYFYSIKNSTCVEEQPHDHESDEIAKPTDSWLIEHVMYNAFRNMLLASSENEKQIIYKLVDLARLYRVFERC
jgi:DNA mismatch repair protein MLH1